MAAKAKILERMTVEKPVSLAHWKAHQADPENVPEPEMIEVDQVKVEFKFGRGKAQTRVVDADKLIAYCDTYEMQIEEDDQ